VQIGKDPSCCSFAVSATPTAAGCTTNDGSIQVSVTAQGTTPYEYSIDGATYQQGTSFSSLAAGSYSVYARDANGCGDTVTVTVTSPANNITLTLVPTNPNCTNANSGSVLANVAGGNGNISYNWNTGGITNTISSLDSGTYRVTVTDGAGCSVSDSATLIPAQQISVDLGNGSSFCSGSNATITAPTGFATYLWNTGDTTQDIDSLIAGTYTVEVLDSNNCQAIFSFTVTEPPLLSLALTQVNVACFGASTASINLTVSGGTTPYNYAWSNNQITEDINGLPIGTYEVIVVD
jgi:hypothetical protein